MNTAEEAEDVNHPLAFRMAIIAGINQNITIAVVFGSFSILLAAVEAHFGIGRQLSTLAIPAVTLATAIFAPVVGSLATKGSLKVILLGGSLLGMLGYVLLAFTASFPLYLVAYGLLIGPGFAAGVILPSALVTRWYAVNRGRTLGIVCAPIMIAVVPLITTRTLQAYGLSTAFLMLAGLSAISVIANLFVIDRPPAAAATVTASLDTSAAPAPATATMIDLLRDARFWALVFTFIASSTGSIVLTANIVPIVSQWGMSATLAATLLSIQSLVGIAGTMIFGWLADGLGGSRALAIVVIDGAVLWLLLLLRPSFPVAAIVIGLIGLHGSGAVPSLSVALSQTFGREAFSRAYGLGNLVNLPFSVFCVPIAALVFAQTGSYAAVIVGEAAFLILTGVVLLLITGLGRRKAVPLDS